MTRPAATALAEISSATDRPEHSTKSPTRAVASVNRFYRPELDALRFFAFLFVFVDHLPLYCHLSYGDVATLGTGRVFVGLITMGAFGVDLFFVLSAYLITSLLLRERDMSGSVDVRRFYARRVLRIWPLYFGFLALSAVAAWMFAEYRVKVIFLLPFLVLLGNFGCSALAGSKALRLLGPLWSISVEEQFYLVWPHVVRCASREWLVRTCLLMLVVSGLARLFAPVLHIRFIWSNTLTRLDPIAIGILIAVTTHPRVPNWRRFTRMVILIAGLSLWIAANVICGIRLPHRTIEDCVIGYPLVALGSGAILLAILGMKAPRKNSCWGALLYLGQISYGLYIFHGIAMTLVRQAIQPANGMRLAVFITASLMLTMTAALLSYRYYETPFLRLKSRFAYVPSRPV